MLRLSKIARLTEQELTAEGGLGPGVPSRSATPLPTVKKPETWEFSAHPHHAIRAGKHIDIRLGNPATGIAHSFVLPRRTELPGPGESALVIPTFDHTIDYMNYTGPISSTYGKGEVKQGRREKTEVYHSDSGDEPGTKLRFNLYEGAHPEEFSIRKAPSGTYVIHNKTQTRERRPDIPSAKPKYKEIDVDQIDPGDNRQAMMPKLDGSHAVIDLKAGRAPRVFSFREAKKTGTGLIEHTHKMPEMLTKKVPPSLDGTILRGEVLGLKDGKAIPAQKIGGLLNSKVWKSRADQESSGVLLKAFPFDVVMHKGKSMEGAPFAEKLKVLREVEKSLVNLDVPPLATSAEEKINLMNTMRAGKHPLTEEGFVLVDKDHAATPIKAKFSKDYDVFVRGVNPAKKKGGGFHDRAGNISYSWTPDGPVAGTLGGFAHGEARDMMANPDKYVGRVAKAKAMKVFTDKEGNPTAMFQPRFQEWHLDKGDIEKAAFLDELQKIADEAPTWVKAMGGAMGAIAGLGAVAMAKPGVRRNLFHELKSLGKGVGGREAERAAGIPVSAIADARKVADQIAKAGLDPASIRIGISGTGGTGKSTLAKALANELGFQDALTRSGTRVLAGKEIPKHIAQQKNLAPGIYEQTHLLNRVDPDKFDVIIRMHKSPDTIRKQLMTRGRGAVQWDIVNYPKFHKSIEEGVKKTEGQILSPTSNIDMKIKPEGGFQADKHLDASLSNLGINPSGLSREAKVYASMKGKKSKGVNFQIEGTPLEILRKDTLGAGLAGLIGGGAAGTFIASKLG